MTTKHARQEAKREKRRLKTKNIQEDTIFDHAPPNQTNVLNLQRLVGNRSTQSLLVNTSMPHHNIQRDDLVAEREGGIFADLIGSDSPYIPDTLLNSANVDEMDEE